uniref:Myb-like DNA-binding domain-containing protein n=1 Tax=Trepomonas sp. PC1 TaxID=1076344 RepID=A0A146KE23_9EUKA|eukprot:JAP93925.1 Hypothetical protein TPC1_13596 [Trepomonas sp. PC1]
MTIPHTFTDRELELIAHGSVEFQKDWRMISHMYMPYLSPISIKNKYYKMVKNGQLQVSLRRLRHQEQESSDDRIIDALYKMAVNCKVIM